MALFSSGISTERDIENLNRAFQPGPGKTVPYAEIEKVIRQPWNSNRFRTVGGAWRRQLGRIGIASTAGNGEIRFLTADQEQDRIPLAIHKVGRATGRLRKKVDLIDPDNLSSDERRARHSLEAREMRHLSEEMRKAAKAILPPQPVTTSSIRLVAPDKEKKA